ncbi:MAG: Gfo/Idh/MocA family oxidoreductase [Candidatus Obscuribacterales bacterium]|nr:Gfo/Idh/MocA family oxidoreductase [Candidatus Obscuribacterales bacterium]
MSKKLPLNVAIVGYGLAGATFHAPLIKSTEGLKVSAIVSRSAEKQAQAKKDFDDLRIFASFEDLLQSASDFDLIVIATPNTEHAPQAIAAMQAGLAVVVDKPVAINSGECRDLIACSKKTGSSFSVFHNRRWDNDFLTIKDLLAKNKLGKILRFESRFERYRPQAKPGAWREKIGAEEGGGILFDLGSHLIDQALELFGKPESVYAEMSVRREGVKSDDDSFVALSFPSGVKAHLWMSAISASLAHRFRVLGTEGAYEKYGLDPQEDALRAGLSPLDKDWGKENRNNWGTLTLYPGGEKQSLALESLDGKYQEFYAGMRDAILGKGEVPVRAESALAGLEIIELAQESAKKQKSLSLT